MAAWKLGVGDQILTCAAIAFDKDGTLVDRQALWWGQFHKRADLLRREYGERLVERWAKAVGVDDKRGMIDPAGLLATGSMEQEGIVLANCLHEHQRMPWDQCLQRAGLLLDHANEALDPSELAAPMPGVPDKVLELAGAGVSLALLTMDTRRNAERALLHLGMADAVSTIVTPADVDRPKPAPDMLEAAAGALKVEPGDTLVVGDTTADLAMADAGGAASVLVVPPGSPAPSAHGAVAVIASLEQIELLGTAT